MVDVWSGIGRDVYGFNAGGWGSGTNAERWSDGYGSGWMGASASAFDCSSGDEVLPVV